MKIKCILIQNNKGIIQNEFYELINQPDQYGNTPLMLAIKLSSQHVRRIEIIKLLLKNGKKNYFFFKGKIIFLYQIIWEKKIIAFYWNIRC
jgi:hypothetical protein